MRFCAFVLAGKDATADFEGAFHSDAAWKKLQTFAVQETKASKVYFSPTFICILSL